MIETSLPSRDREGAVGPATDYRQYIYASYGSEKMHDWLSREEAGYKRWATACLHRMRGWLPARKDAECLDIGCGPGNMLYTLRLDGYQHVRGVDRSPQWMDVAHKICPNVDCDDVRTYLERYPNSFDLITAFDLVEHFRKDELLDLLGLAARALKPGGTLILQTPNAESPWGTMHRYHDLTHELSFDPHSLGHVLGLAGLSGFEARECGPVVRGGASFLRFLLWKTIWTLLAAWNLAEVGHIGSGVYTRVFLAKAIKL